MSQELKHFIEDILRSSDYSILPLRQDASSRQYFRVSTNNGSYILQHFDKVKFDPQDFFDITAILQENKINCPRIINYSEKDGLILLEDLGAVSLKQHIISAKQSGGDIEGIYKKIIDLLIELQQINTAQLKSHHSAEVMIRGVRLFTNFFPLYNGQLIKEGLLNIWTSILNQTKFSDKVFLHRDYHLQNIMLYNGELALIDYQDASIGSPLYDLVSLLQDARIDVSQELEDRMISYFCDQKNINRKDVVDEYNILGCQRNLRVLGVFTYQSIRNNNDNYIQYIPRILGYLKRNLSNPILVDVEKYLIDNKILL